MPYKVSTEGMDDLSRMLDSLGNAAQGVAAAALYEGAGIMADAVSRAVHGIAVEPFKYAAHGNKRKPSPEEKAILLGAGTAGISRFRKNGLTVDTSVGFNNAGYASVTWKHMSRSARTNYKHSADKSSVTPSYMKSAKGGNAKPVAVIANAINSGTSFMDKQPFFRKAVSQAKGPAISRIDSEAQRMADEIIKNGG